jgi:hypothetical protein
MRFFRTRSRHGAMAFCLELLSGSASSNFLLSRFQIETRGFPVGGKEPSGRGPLF